MSSTDDLYVAATKPGRSCCNRLCNCSYLFRKYDKTFMTIFGLQYFNAGLKYMFALAIMDLFKNYYEIEPT